MQFFRAIALIAAGLALAWLVITKSLVAFLGGTAPQAALWLDPHDPNALLARAESRLQSAPAAGVPLEKTRGWAEAALARDPVSARGWRILGQLADAAGDEPRAMVFMQAVARRSIQESAALHWLLQRADARKDYTEALRLADILLRTRSPSMPHVLPVLSRMAETPEAVGALEQLLATNPPWRRAFFASLPRAVTDARTPLRLLLAVRAGPDAPTLPDIREYVRLLVGHKLYELAYYTWLQVLPPDQLAGVGPLFNGSFEHDPSGLVFEWVMEGGTGATTEIALRPDWSGQRALLVSLGPGRVDLRGVSQQLLLAPGTYRLQGKYQGEVLGPRGLVWRIGCGAGTALGQSPMMLGTAPDWKEIAFAFTVPEADCRAQQLRLVLDARMASEQLVAGRVWIDDLRIVREE